MGWLLQTLATNQSVCVASQHPCITTHLGLRTQDKDFYIHSAQKDRCPEDRWPITVTPLTAVCSSHVLQVAWGTDSPNYREGTFQFSENKK